jgi:HEAT repeat protein
MKAKSESGSTRDPNPLVRRAATGSLGRLGGEATLREVYRDPDPKIRRAGREALVRTADVSAVPTLDETLEGRESSVRDVAAQMYGSIRPHLLGEGRMLEFAEPVSLRPQPFDDAG